MIRLPAIALLALSLLVPGLSRAQTGMSSPVAVIDAQIAAFAEDDFVTAFTYASDMIRQIFGTPERFGQMVVEGYPMVYRPGRVRYLERGERRGATIQRVLMTDLAGDSFLLEYEMVETPDGLRINGVRLLPDAGAGV